MEKHMFAPGNTSCYDREHGSFSLEDIRLEVSSYGKGDIREPFVELVLKDGSTTSDFRFVSAEITTGKEPFETLPGSYDEADNVEHLCVTLRDNNCKTAEEEGGLFLELHYYVYCDCDVITRSARLLNQSGEPVVIRRLMSMQLDFDTPDYVFSTFNGAWAREMRRYDHPVSSGKHVNSSYTGTSSNRANPFVMLAKEQTTEDAGACYGFNLIYSGNHYEAAEVSGYGKTRIVTGINPQSFSWNLESGGGV